MSHNTENTTHAGTGPVDQRGARMSNRPTPSTAMLYALELVAGGMPQREAAKAAGVSLSGIVKALKRAREAMA